MAQTLYVPTDEHGVEHRGEKTISWPLPTSSPGGSSPGEAVSGNDPPLLLREAIALLDTLDEAIFYVEPLGDVISEAPSIYRSAAARLVAPTSWSPKVAATFALDCAEHATSGLADIELPGGAVVGTVLDDARRALGTTVDGETRERLGRLARLAVARRLRRHQQEVGALALEMFSEDLDKDLDALDDPAWSTLAGLSDALLAAIDAIRLFHASRTDSNERAHVPQVTLTPWGPIAFGVDRGADDVSVFVAARDAAERARSAVAERSGEESGVAETIWQAQRLEALLES